MASKTPTQTLLVVGNEIPADYRERFERQSLCMSPAFLRVSPAIVPETIRVVITYGTLQQEDARVVYEIAASRLLTTRSAESQLMLEEFTSAYRSLRPGKSISDRTAPLYFRPSKKQ